VFAIAAPAEQIARDDAAHALTARAAPYLAPGAGVGAGTGAGATAGVEVRLPG
jgi:hypothetical protein